MAERILGSSTVRLGSVRQTSGCSLSLEAKSLTAHRDVERSTCGPNAGVDGVDVFLQRVGDLRPGEAFDVGQDQDQPLLTVQAGEHFAYTSPGLPALDDGFQVGAWILLLGGEHGTNPVSAGQAAPVMHRDPFGYAVEPPSSGKSVR